MLVQALAQYADTYLADELRHEEWEERPVPYLLELADDGTFLDIVERMTTRTAGKTKKSISIPHQLTVPRSPVNRNTGLHPLLGADDIKYVLGVGPWTGKGQTENHSARHEAFVELLARAAKETDDPALLACARFYNNPAEVEKARAKLKEAKNGTLIALSMRGPVTERPAVQEYWERHYRKAFGERVENAAAFGECLVSGELGAVAPTHGKIKGASTLGGQPAGVSLMSFDKESFRSYGWEQNENSPMCTNRAMAYVLALNDLMRKEKGRRHDVAGVGFIYWLKKPQEFNPFDILNQADEKQVTALLNLDPADPEPNEFYMAGVTANGGRLRVRYWVSDSLAQIKHNLGQWFKELSIAGWGGAVERLPFWQLLKALDREGAEPPPGRGIALLRRAIEGRAQPLGYRLLGAALERLRRSGESTPARMALVRMCVNDLIYVRNKGEEKGEKEMTESLDPGQTHPAYLCGRLLAEYEGLQYSVSPQVNQSVADRYYSLASTYPAIAFPKMEDLGKKHLRKLQRDNRGAAIAIEKRLQELHQLLEQSAGYRFPAMLNLDEQGRFALGYHHQRAHSFAQAKARNKTQGEENQ